jgi:hypothetical protein
LLIVRYRSGSLAEFEIVRDCRKPTAVDLAQRRFVEMEETLRWKPSTNSGKHPDVIPVVLTGSARDNGRSRGEAG